MLLLPPLGRLPLLLGKGPVEGRRAAESGEQGQLLDLVVVFGHQPHGVLHAAAVDVVAEREAQLVVEELREVRAVRTAFGRHVDDRQPRIEVEPPRVDGLGHLCPQGFDPFVLLRDVLFGLLFACGLRLPVVEDDLRDAVLDDTAVEHAPDGEREGEGEDDVVLRGGEGDDADVGDQVEGQNAGHPAHPAQVDALGEGVGLGDLLGVEEREAHDADEGEDAVSGGVDDIEEQCRGQQGGQVVDKLVERQVDRPVEEEESDEVGAAEQRERREQPQGVAQVDASGHDQLEEEEREQRQREQIGKGEGGAEHLVVVEGNEVAEELLDLDQGHPTQADGKEQVGPGAGPAGVEEHPHARRDEEGEGDPVEEIDEGVEYHFYKVQKKIRTYKYVPTIRL